MVEKIALLVAGFAGVPDDECPIFGQLLVSFDFEAHNGQGFGEFDYDPKRAKLFDTLEEAMTFWRTPSQKFPVRLIDGRLNRPLTCTTIQFVKVNVDEKGEASFVNPSER